MASKDNINRPSPSSQTTSGVIDTSTDDSGDTEPPLSSPDGGYGWIVVLSAFFTFVISDGFAFAFGVLYTELLQKFKESRSVTAWIPSLFYGLPLLCGPISGALATKYGCRTTQIAGGILASVGVFVSAFADSIAVLCFTLGIVTGIGMSMGYVTSLVTVAFYFEKKRALATGIAVSGSGLGTFAMAPLFEFLIVEYKWKGTLIILSAVTLNLVVCGALLRPVEQYAFKDSEIIKSSDNGDDTEIMITVENEKQKSIHEESVFIKRNPLEHRDSLEVERRHSNKRHSENRHSVIKPLPFLKRISFQKKPGKGLRNTRSLPVRRQFSSMKLLRPTRSLPLVARRLSLPAVPLYRTDLFYRGNLSKLKRARDRPKSVKGIQFGPVKVREQTYEEERRRSSVPRVLKLSSRMKRLILLMFDKEVLRTPLFLAFLLSNFTLYFCYDVPYVYIVDYAKQNGVEATKATFLVSIIGILTTIGQISFGYIGDKEVNLSVLYGCSLTLAGISLFILPILSTYVGVTIVAASFGLFVSVDYALDTCLMVKFVGMDKLTSAYGISMMFQGIANLLGPPIAGILYDMTGDYRVTFFFAGSCIFFSGFLVAFFPLIRFIQRILRQRKSQDRKGNSGDIAT